MKSSFIYQIGKGGFSLRKIKKMIEATNFYKEKINCMLADEKPSYPKDIFLLLELDNECCQLKK